MTLRYNIVRVIVSIYINYSNKKKKMTYIWKKSMKYYAIFFLTQMRIIIKSENSYLYLKTLIVDNNRKIINCFNESKGHITFVTMMFICCNIKLVITASRKHTAVYFFHFKRLYFLKDEYVNYVRYFLSIILK